MFNISLHNAKDWLIGFLLLTLFKPYFFWHTPLYLFAIIILFFIILMNFRVKKNDFIGVFLLTIFYLLVGLRHNGSTLGMIFILIIPLYICINTDLLIAGFSKFAKILSIITVFSLLSYILITLLGVNLPSRVIQPLNPLKDFDYLLYPFLIMEDRNIGLEITRFYCIFDEPGVYGSLAAILLCKEHFNFRKIELIPIFIGGLLTFSLYFYLVCIFYFFLYARLKIKLSIIIVILVLLPTLLMVEDLRVLLFNRFKFENGQWLGNSRYGSVFSTWYEGFKNSSDYWIGKGAGYNLIVNQGGATYKDIIVNYGILIFILYIGSYIILTLKVFSNKREFILSSFLILSFIFQRPFIFDLSVVYLFIYCYSYHGGQDVSR